MFGLFLKKLATDTSAEEIRRITTILEQHSIKYEVRTERTRGTIGLGLDAASYAKANLALYKGANGPSFIYSVYVSGRNFNMARKLMQVL